MKLVKATKNYSIYKRGDGRFAVTDARKQPINGEAKAKILLEEALIKLPTPATSAAAASGDQEPAATSDAEPSTESE